MRTIKRLAGAVALGFWAGTALADEAITVAGRQVAVTSDGMGSATLSVDGAVLHENGAIYLDPELLTVGGVTVITGSAGAGGNACNAAPFVLAFPEGGAPEFHGPVDSCAYLPITDVQPEAITWSAEPVPSTPGEVWIWGPQDGLVKVSPEVFAPTDGAGWEAFDALADVHPADAMRRVPVFEALQAGLGEDYPVFADRISELGAGNLTAEGYLGSACLKFTCEADWAILYLHRESRRVFAVWHVMGEIENHVWPADTTLWPPEAITLLQGSAGE
jgi:hypothetical protein